MIPETNLPTDMDTMSETPELTEVQEPTDILTADASSAGTRIDTFLSERTGLSRSAVARLIEEGNVLVNGRETRFQPWERATVKDLS